MYIHKNASGRILKKIMERMNELRPEEEWLFSHPMYKGHSTPVPILIQQDLEILNKLEKEEKMAMHSKKKGGMRGGMKNGMKNGTKNGKMQNKMNGLTAAQKKLPPALQAAILKSKKKVSKESSLMDLKKANQMAGFANEYIVIMTWF